VTSSQGDRAVLAITFLIQVAATAATMSPTVAAPEMILRLHLPSSAVGIFVACVYGCALMSSQFGVVLVQRWGPIRVSQVSLAMCAASLIVCSVPSSAAFFSGGCLLGIGYGCITPASAHILASTTSAKNYGLVFSVRQTGVPIGGAVAGAVVPLVLADAGLQAALSAVSLLCVVAAVLARPFGERLDADREAGAAMPDIGSLTRAIRFVWADPILRGLAWCSLCLSAVQVTVTAYLVTYLTAAAGWSLIAAGSALAVLQVSGAVGRIGWGVVADGKIGDRKTLMLLAFLMTITVPLLAVIRNTTPQPMALLLLAVCGATAVGWNGVLTATFVRRVHPVQAALVTSGGLLFTYAGVMLGPIAFGALISWSGAWRLSFSALALPLVWVLVSFWRMR
jgi:sugar phosphate permease